MDNKKIFRYIAIASFALQIVLAVADCLKYKMLPSASDLLWMASIVLLALACILPKRKLIVVGAALLITGSVYGIVQHIISWFQLGQYGVISHAFAQTLVPIAAMICLLIIRILLLLFGLGKGKAKDVGIIIATLFVAVYLLNNVVLTSILSERPYIYISLSLVISYILDAAGLIALCMAFSDEEQCEAGISVTKQSKTVETENKLDQLLRLKDLLDKGILTQEEFDSKKNEILNI